MARRLLVRRMVFIVVFAVLWALAELSGWADDPEDAATLYRVAEDVSPFPVRFPAAFRDLVGDYLPPLRLDPGGTRERMW